MRIKKVINNNIVCAIDEKGNEMIATGRGLGFKRKTGEFIDPKAVEKVYRMEDKPAQKKLRELVNEIPLEHLELTVSMVEEIKAAIRQPINESLIITLADHISFAIQRKKQGIEFKNPLADSIMSYYPTEYRLGLSFLKKIEDAFSVKLHPDEAAFVALHIVNAQLNSGMSVMQDMTQLLDGCVRVTEFYYNKKFDKTSLDFSRFVVHLRYLVQRLYQNKALESGTDDSDVMFRELIKRNCREHYECACRIASYIETNSEMEVPEEERIYITIHLKRLNLTGD